MNNKAERLKLLNQDLASSTGYLKPDGTGTVPLSTKISKEADSILHTIHWFDVNWSKRAIIEKSMELFQEWYGQERLIESKDAKHKAGAVDLEKSSSKRIVLKETPPRKAKRK